MTINLELERLIAFWCSYLEQAKKDFFSKSKSLKAQAKKWFSSKDYSAGSFLWVCDVINEDPRQIKQELSL